MRKGDLARNNNDLALTVKSVGSIAVYEVKVVILGEDVQKLIYLVCHEDEKEVLA